MANLQGVTWVTSSIKTADEWTMSNLAVVARVILGSKDLKIMIKAREGPHRTRMDDHLGTAVDAGLGLNFNTACIGKWRVPKSLVRLPFRFILELKSSEGYMLDASLHLLGTTPFYFQFLIHECIKLCKNTITKWLWQLDYNLLQSIHSHIQTHNVQHFSLKCHFQRLGDPSESFFSSVKNDYFCSTRDGFEMIWHQKKV